MISLFFGDTFLEIVCRQLSLSVLLSRLVLFNGSDCARNNVEWKISGLKVFLLFLAVAFCGLMGYDEFVHNSSWIKKILSWQQETGCYGLNSLKITKRKEKIIDSSGCLAHTTAMALGALVINLKYLLSQHPLIHHAVGCKEDDQFFPYTC